MLRVKKQILHFPLFFTLLLLIFSGISVSSAQVEVDRQWQGHANGTTVTIPPDFLKRTENGKLRISFGRNEGDGFDDTFRRKPRPYFDGEGLWVDNFEKLRQKMSDLLDYIEFLFDAPERELTPDQLASALDELETLNNERHRLEAEHQQEVTEAISVNADLGDNWRFTHHSGYQEHHPAHPHHEPYKVPGIVQTPIRKEANTKGGHGQTTSAQGSGTASSNQPVANGKSDKKRASDSSDGDGSRPPKKPGSGKEPERAINPPVKKKTVEKKIEVGGVTYFVTSELTDDDLELICPICLDLLKTEVKKCNECYKFICAEDYKKLSKPGKCPCCRNFPLERFVDVEPGYLEHRVNNLQWLCPKGCGYSGDLQEMTTHIRSCGEEYECEHQDCGYTGSLSEVETHEQHCGFAPVECSHEGCQEHPHRQNLEEHLSICKWRQVNLGSVQFFAWQKDLIDRHSMDMPGNVAPENIEDETQFVISLLVHKIRSAKLSEEKDVEKTRYCYGCGKEYLKTFIESHERECPMIRVACEHCGELQGRTELNDHYRRCPMYPSKCSMPGCEYTVPKIEWIKLHRHENQHCLELNGIILWFTHYLPDAESIRYVSVDRESYLIRFPRELNHYFWHTGFSIPDWNLLVVPTGCCGNQCMAFAKLEYGVDKLPQNTVIRLYDEEKLIAETAFSRCALMKLRKSELLIVILIGLRDFTSTRGKAGLILKLSPGSLGRITRHSDGPYRNKVKYILP